MTEIKETLIKIKEVADEILETHKNSTDKFSGVNYGDLFVRDVSYIISFYDEEGYYEVLIEECSPIAYDFREYMLESLKDKLGFGVNVVCEW